MKEIRVVAAYIQKDGRFLIGKRPPHKARGGLWEFVGGKIEPGETPEQALMRECREELDVSLLVLEPYAEQVEESDEVRLYLTLFRAEITEGTVRQLEHSDLRWITPPEIPQYEFCPSDAEMLEKVIAEAGEGSRSPIAIVRKHLQSLSDAAYRKLQHSILPTVAPSCILGTRIPLIRAYAKQLAKNPALRDAFLQSLPHCYLEENLLHGMLIEQMPSCAETVDALQVFLSYVDNWVVCDCLNPRSLRKDRHSLHRIATEWLSDAHPYTVRFAIRLFMDHFLTEDFSVTDAMAIARVRSEEYYVRMMQAWYFATALAKQYDAILPILENRCLAEWTHRKTIQKAVESRRITPEQKQTLRSLK